MVCEHILQQEFLIDSKSELMANCNVEISKIMIKRAIK